ncbi:MAG: hypothetical protein PF518_19180 [Spirochaetaceae bacterium]|nr:hypothetical protein [Spirochaetaceae bacterium]
MKRICLIFILVNTAVILFSQSVWTGNAAVSSEKEFESYYSENSSTGRYLGASNSFPGSTEVTITNPRNGKTVLVSIVKRLSQPGLFLVLSPEAGKVLDLPDDDILNVEVEVKRKNEEIFSTYSEDKPYSDDPDLNPSAEILASTTADQIPESDSNGDNKTAATVGKAVEPKIEPPVGTGVNEYIPPVVFNSDGVVYDEGYDALVLLDDKEENSKPEEIVEIIDDPLVLPQSITGSVSEPEIPLPETYDSTDLPDSYETENITDTVIDSSPEVIGITPENENFSDTLDNRIVMTEPELLDSELVERGFMEPEALDSEFMDADINDLLITKQPEKVPETGNVEITENVIESEMETEIEETPANVIYFLTPGDFRPPPQTVEKKEKIKEKTIVALPVEKSEIDDMIVRELRNGGSYLQLGIYGSVEVLYSHIEKINKSYPSIVLTMGDENNQLYKLLIGPISRDEKGIILTRFRSQGYEDAFLYSPK